MAHDNPRYVKPTTERVRVDMEGDSGEVTVNIAGFSYIFRVTSRSDAAFTLTEYAPGDEVLVIAQGAEQ